MAAAELKRKSLCFRGNKAETKGRRVTVPVLGTLTRKNSLPKVCRHYHKLGIPKFTLTFLENEKYAKITLGLSKQCFS